ncbi:MAG: pyrimidine 5'-nucleotidase [Candidatus Diapherotrites archaeon]
MQSIVFDLDETLYPKGIGLLGKINERIVVYIQGKLNCPKEEAEKARVQLYQEYGSTVTGLMKKNLVDPLDYFSFITNIDIDVNKLLHENLELKRILDSIECRKYIFTNAIESHAFNVINALGLKGCFDGVYGQEFLEFGGKQNHSSFKKFISATGIEPEKSAMVDDEKKSLVIAKDFGMKTVFVGGKAEEFDFCINRIEGIKEVWGKLNGMNT